MEYEMDIVKHKGEDLNFKPRMSKKKKEEVEAKRVKYATQHRMHSKSNIVSKFKIPRLKRQLRKKFKIKTTELPLVDGDFLGKTKGNEILIFISDNFKKSLWVNRTKYKRFIEANPESSFNPF